MFFSRLQDDERIVQVNDETVKIGTLVVRNNAGKRAERVFCGGKGDVWEECWWRYDGISGVTQKKVAV